MKILNMKKNEKIDDVVTEKLSEMLLQAKNESGADGALLYIVDKDAEKLRFIIGVNDALGINDSVEVSYDKSDKVEDFRKVSDVAIYDENTGSSSKSLNDKNVCVAAFVNKQNINIPDIYKNKSYDLSEIVEFDEATGYKTGSMLVMPVIGRDNKVIAVIQLVNARDINGNVVPFKIEKEKVVSLIIKSAVVELDNDFMEAEYKKLMESFVRVMAKAVDDKSSYKGMHCQKVPLIAKKLVSALCDSKEKVFENFKMSDDERYALYIASWLHDCGKLVIPEYIVDKATKLETVHNRIHEIRARFEILLRDARIKYLESVIKNPDDEEEYREEYKNEVSVLRKEFTFVAKCNVGDVALTEKGIEKIKQISKRTYVRNFDRTLGLSRTEISRLDKEEAEKFPVEENLLQDRKEDVIGGCNRGEIYNLTVKYGTLTEEEKNIIDSHVGTTVEMLRSIRFPERYHNVLEYAASHHEKLDGTGYPRGIKGGMMSIPARVLALADVFEALSSVDRPYKKDRKLSEILNIMKSMAANGHIDPDLFYLFVKAEVYKDYARDFMKPEQLDEVNVADLLSDYDVSKSELTYPVSVGTTGNGLETDKNVLPSDKSLSVADNVGDAPSAITVETQDKKGDAGDIGTVEVKSLNSAGDLPDTKVSDSEIVAGMGDIAADGLEKANTGDNAVLQKAPDIDGSVKGGVSDGEQKTLNAASIGKIEDSTMKSVPDGMAVPSVDTDGRIVENIGAENEDTISSFVEAKSKISNDEHLARRLAEDSSSSGQGSSVLDDTSLFSGEETSKISPSELGEMVMLPPLLSNENDDKTPVFSSDPVFADASEKPIVMEKEVAAAVNKVVIPTPVVQDEAHEATDSMIGEEFMEGRNGKGEETAGDIAVDISAAAKVVDNAQVSASAPSAAAKVADNAPVSASVPSAAAKVVDNAQVSASAPSAAAKVVDSAQVSPSAPSAAAKVVDNAQVSPSAGEVSQGSDRVVSEKQSNQKNILRKITHLFTPPKVVRNIKLPPPPPFLRKDKDENSSVS